MNFPIGGLRRRHLSESFNYQRIVYFQEACRLELHDSHHGLIKIFCENEFVLDFLQSSRLHAVNVLKCQAVWRAYAEVRQ